MYRYLCKKLLEITHTKNPSTSFHLLQNPYPKSLFYSSNPTNLSSLTLSYLINSWGLSQESALTVANKVSLKTTENSDSVLTFLREHDFNQTQISNLIAKRPRLLLCNVDKTLKPKFKFLLGLGFSGPDLARTVTSDPTILSRSLQKQIIPSYHMLKSLVHTDENVISALKSRLSILLCDRLKIMLSNILLLRKHMVPDSRIVKLITTDARTLKWDSDRFVEIIKGVEGMNFDPSSSAFIKAVQAFSLLNKLGWERKMEVYRSLGWSDKEIISAFKKQPMCMMASEKKIRRGMSYFMNELDMNPWMISQCPNIILHSLEKRVVPRHYTMEVLMSRNLVERNFSMSYVLILSEKNFLKMFVTKYQDELPELLKDYRAKMQLTG